MDWFVVLTYVLWLAAPAMQVVLGVRMLRGKVYREFPRFFVYTAAQLIWVSTLFITYHRSKAAYVYCFWSIEALDALLVLAVIQEIYFHLFKPYQVLHGLATRMFRTVALGLFGFAILSAAFSSGSERSPMTAALLAFDRGVNFVECGLIIVAVVLARTLALSWRSYAFGIALGFGVTGAVMVLMTTIRWYFGDVTNTLYKLGAPAAYNLGVLVWVIYFLAPARQGNVIPVQAATRDLQQWNVALTELLRR